MTPALALNLRRQIAAAETEAEARELIDRARPEIARLEAHDRIQLMAEVTSDLLRFPKPPTANVRDGQRSGRTSAQNPGARDAD